MPCVLQCRDELGKFLKRYNLLDLFKNRYYVKKKDIMGMYTHKHTHIFEFVVKTFL